MLRKKKSRNHWRCTQQPNNLRDIIYRCVESIQTSITMSKIQWWRWVAPGHQENFQQTTHLSKSLVLSRHDGLWPKSFLERIDDFQWLIQKKGYIMLSGFWTGELWKTKSKSTQNSSSPSISSRYCTIVFTTSAQNISWLPIWWWRSKQKRQVYWGRSKECFLLA